MLPTPAKRTNRALLPRRVMPLTRRSSAASVRGLRARGQHGQTSTGTHRSQRSGRPQIDPTHTRVRGLAPKTPTTYSPRARCPNPPNSVVCRSSGSISTASITTPLSPQRSKRTLKTPTTASASSLRSPLTPIQACQQGAPTGPMRPSRCPSTLFTVMTVPSASSATAIANVAYVIKAMKVAMTTVLLALLFAFLAVSLLPMSYFRDIIINTISLWTFIMTDTKSH